MSGEVTDIGPVHSPDVFDGFGAGVWEGGGYEASTIHVGRRHDGW